jgi:formylglycine-generating enzyme
MFRFPWILSMICAGAAQASTVNPAEIDWQPLDGFVIARTETTVGQYRRHALALKITTQAERAGGGSVYENGWTAKPGWTWREPYGRQAADDEPAVHLTHGEAQAFCRWAGGRLPNDREWRSAAYLEQRRSPPAPFERGRSYPYPSGNSPQGAICLGDCGEAARQLAVDHGAQLMRGAGHAPAGRSRPGVNGLFDMGGNVWEWVDDPPSKDPIAERLTRGGSWWYGAESMRAEHRQTKPGTTTVVYIGFRCVR